MPLVRIQIRRDTAANWTAANPVLAAGEPAVETDTGKTKTGDGIRNWDSLPYDIVSFLASSSPAAVGVSAAAGTAVVASRADHVHALPSAISCATITTSGSATIGGDLEVKGKLTASAQTVAAANVTGLSEAVDDRVAAFVVAGTGISLTHDDAANSLTVSVGSHSQAISTVTGLQAALDAKAATSHSHKLADTEGLEAALSLRPTSDTSNIIGASQVTNVVFLGQVAYDAIASKSPTTLYVIV